MSRSCVRIVVVSGVRLAILSNLNGSRGKISALGERSDDNAAKVKVALLGAVSFEGARLPGLSRWSSDKAMWRFEKVLDARKSLCKSEESGLKVQ